MSTEQKTIKFGKEELRVMYSTPNVYRDDIGYDNVRIVSGEEYMRLNSYSPSGVRFESTIKFQIGEQKYVLTSAHIDLFSDGTGCGVARLFKVVEKTGTSSTKKNPQTFKYEVLEKDETLGTVVFFAVGCQHVWRAPKKGEWEHQPFGRCVTNYICDKCGAKNSVDSSD